MVPQSVTHALVDGVRYPQALERLYGHDDVAEIEPLYLSTRWASLAEQGPILVRLKGAGLLGEVLDESVADAQGARPRSLSWLCSDASTAELGKHLRQFVTVTLDGQHETLLRFADPLVTRHWLASYRPSLPASVMGPIATWWVAAWSPNWATRPALSWQAFQPDATTEDAPHRDVASPPHRFGPGQGAALDAVARWQLKERLTAHFRVHAANAWQRLVPEARGEWLDARLAEARDAGAVTQRQAAIWIELALYWGADFMTRADGPYRQWQAATPDHATLSREQMLYALEAWRDAPGAPPAVRPDNDQDDPGALEHG